MLMMMQMKRIVRMIKYNKYNCKFDKQLKYTIGVFPYLRFQYAMNRI